MDVKVAQGYFDLGAAMDGAGNYTSLEIPYFVFGVATEEEALAAVLDSAPTTYKRLLRDGLKFGEMINETSAKVLVAYKGASGEISPDDGDAFSFDTTGGTQTVTQSRSSVARYPGNAADLGGAINYDGEQVNGVEIVQPVLNFTETGIFDKGEITSGFRKLLASMTGTVNLAAWRGYEAGELLFRGVTGSGKTNLPCELTFYFSYSQNRKNFTVGDITVAEKKGWDYMWVRYADKVDTDSKSLVRKPIAVYIEQLFTTESFAKLKIGN